MSNAKYICIRACYYGPPGNKRLYRPGERLQAGKPNKHFVPASEFHRGLINKAPTSPQDDPRSTARIIQELKHKYGVVLCPETTSRVEAFRAWIKAEDRARETPSGKQKSSNSADGVGRDQHLTGDEVGT